MTPLIGGHIEAGTLLHPFGGFHHPIAILVRTQIAMSAYPCDREILLQGAYQGSHREFLLLRPCIGRKALFVQSAFVGDADAVLVMSQRMGTYLFQWSGAPDITVLADIEVVAHTGHSFSPMTTEQVFLGKIHIYPGCGAMHYNYRDASLHPTQAVTPSAPAIADATAITTFKTISHTFFFTINFQLKCRDAACSVKNTFVCVFTQHAASLRLFLCFHAARSVPTIYSSNPSLFSSSFFAGTGFFGTLA